MIYNQNMAQQYNRNKILTATPAELTLLLYEGAIKFCNIAQVAIEKNETTVSGSPALAALNLSSLPDVTESSESPSI